MHETLRRRFDRLELKKRSLFEALESQPDEILNRSPAAGEWSVVQVLGHLSLAEELSVGYLRKKMGAAAPPAGWIHRLKSEALSLALRSPLKFKAPPRSTEVPANEPLAVVRQRWDGVRLELEAILDAVPDEAVSQAVFRHPRVGMLSLEQALRFVEEHIDHHRRQVERVLAQVG